MIKINDILTLVNSSLETHYFKDITFYKVAELVKSIEDDDAIVRPHIYTGNGDYTFIQDDTKGLIVYHRIIKISQDEDKAEGFGRFPLTTLKYEVKTVFYGQQSAIEDDDCEDINSSLSQEFKKLVPRRLSLIDNNSIIVSDVDVDKTKVASDEGLEITPNSVCFALTLNIEVTTTENCNDIDCGNDIFKECADVTVTDNGTVTEVASGGAYTCLGIQPSGIAYQRPLPTGQTTIYRTGDDGWQVANNPYADSPIYPVSYAILSTFTTLVSSNSWGNSNRFTDTLGGQTYANDIVQDHLTGLDIYRIIQSSTFDDACDNSQSSVIGGYTNWRLPNNNELLSIADYELLNEVNYSPFNLNLGNIPTSTTSASVTTHNFYLENVGRGRLLSQAKTTSSARWIWIRNRV